MLAQQIDQIPSPASLVGENPLWHAETQSLYWCDIPNGVLHRLHAPSGEHHEARVSGAIGGFTLQRDGTLLLFLDNGRVASWSDGRMRVCMQLPEEENNRFNDVIADSVGRVLCGTMSPPHRLGRLYLLDTDGSVRTLLENVGCSNGMAFTPDGKTLYHTDSRTRSITRYDYDQATGNISNATLFTRLTEAEGTPDGATMDSDGNLWSALWNGSSIARFRADGTIDRRMTLPTRKVSSLTFAGEHLSDIYVTTASLDETDDGSGHLYCIRGTGIHGRPENRSNIQFK